jgi:hypothetical protein
MTKLQFSPGRALLIGFGADLPSTIDDAKGLAGILKDPSRSAYPPEQVALLTGPAANRPGILAALDRLREAADEETTAIVYFSGHGFRVTSEGGKAYYLMPRGYDIKRLSETAISGAEFVERLLAIPARKLLLLLDCCHAGGLAELLAPGLQFAKAPMPQKSLTLLGEGRGRVVIAFNKMKQSFIDSILLSQPLCSSLPKRMGRGKARIPLQEHRRNIMA